MIHFTDRAGEHGIILSQAVVGNAGVFAVPAKNVTGWGTGLSRERLEQAVAFPDAAKRHFNSVSPVGPYSIWKWSGGVSYSSKCSINISTGEVKAGSRVWPLIVYGPDGIFWGAATSMGTYWYSLSTRAAPEESFYKAVRRTRRAESLGSVPPIVDQLTKEAFDFVPPPRSMEDFIDALPGA